MLKEVDIRRYQPAVIKEYREFQALAETENIELTQGWTETNTVFLNQFINTLTEEGCKRWEKMLNIQVRGTDTLETRRFRILSRLNENLPYTYRMLKNYLDTLCGIGNYEMTLFAKEYQLKILLELGIKKMFDDVEQAVKRMIPANILLEVALRYNQHSTVGQYTHGQLAKWTHKTIREEVLTHGNLYNKL